MDGNRTHLGRLSTAPQTVLKTAGGANMGLTLTGHTSRGRVLRRRTAGAASLALTGRRGQKTPATRGLGRRFNRSDLSNLLEVREPARRRDVALETDHVGRESSSDQT